MYMETYDRYSKFRNNGTISIVPFIKIKEKNTDYYETYIRGVTRLDILSYKYYGNANYDWLIMQANSKYGSMEFNIPDKSNLRIPYPLNTTLELYNSEIEKYIELYGID